MSENPVAINPKSSSYYSNTRPEMLKYIPSNVKIALKVGCAEGHFGATLKSSRNIEIWGIENEPGPAAEASKKLDKVLVGNLEKDAFDLPLEYFDCVICNDVLEHLVDPWQALNRFSLILKPGGYIVASVPNIRYFKVIKKLLLKKERRYVNKGLLDKTHLRFFTKSTIALMFEYCQYHVLKIEGINKERFRVDFALLNGLFLNSLSDMRYMQFACVAQKPDAGLDLSGNIVCP